MSATGWVNDDVVLRKMDDWNSYDFGDGDYSWANGLPSAGGRVLSWKGHEVTLSRKPSTNRSPAVWSPVVEDDEKMEKVIALYKKIDKKSKWFNYTRESQKIYKYRPIESSFLKLIMLLFIW
jgi:hypothetical protein